MEKLIQPKLIQVWPTFPVSRLLSWLMSTTGNGTHYSASKQTQSPGGRQDWVLDWVGRQVSIQYLYFKIKKHVKYTCYGSSVCHFLFFLRLVIIPLNQESDGSIRAQPCGRLNIVPLQYLWVKKWELGSDLFKHRFLYLFNFPTWSFSC